MSQASDARSEDFLRIADQFKLGNLVTESSHSVTAELSHVASNSIPQALRLLFEVDRDVVRTYRKWSLTDAPLRIASVVSEALRVGGSVFFTGCGSTGRLSIQLNSIWRHFWQQTARNGAADASIWEERARSVMAGGDFALIKSVEGFEDFTEFGKQQIADQGVSPKDVVFAITEGGETSFVIGTAWKAVEVGAKVYFVYNNPDSILKEHVERSSEIIENPRIEKINLTTGPMAISGSTRMQATTIQLCAMLTVLEITARLLLGDTVGISDVPARMADGLDAMLTELASEHVRERLAEFVAMEESEYRNGRRNNYHAHHLAIDVLTDTTERSPTFCTPPFRKFDDTTAADSWAFLYVPEPTTPAAWRWILKRDPECVAWTKRQVAAMVGPEKADRQHDIVARIGENELMRFRVGQDGIGDRPLTCGDSTVVVCVAEELAEGEPVGQALAEQLQAARHSDAATGLIRFGDSASDTSVSQTADLTLQVNAPATDLLLDGIRRAGVKMLMNALSTCVMVRLGRVMGNTMIYVVPSNLKLIDRSTRYISRLTGLDYTAANKLLFDVIEYVEPRMRTDAAYPPVVGMVVVRHRRGVGNAEAEAFIAKTGFFSA